MDAKPPEIGRRKSRFGILAAKGETELAILLVQQKRFSLYVEKMKLTKTQRTIDKRESCQDSERR